MGLELRAIGTVNDKVRMSSAVEESTPFFQHRSLIKQLMESPYLRDAAAWPWAHGGKKSAMLKFVVEVRG